MRKTVEANPVCPSLLRSFKKNDKGSGALEDNYDAVNPTHICRTETTSDASR
jgi:hypothetical protein